MLYIYHSCLVYTCVSNEYCFGYDRVSSSAILNLYDMLEGTLPWPMAYSVITSPFLMVELQLLSHPL